LTLFQPTAYQHFFHEQILLRARRGAISAMASLMPGDNCASPDYY
jgi:hypothetical protein